MYHHFFIHFSTHGDLGCVQILGIVNNAAANIGCMYSVKSVLQVSSDIFAEVELLGHTAGALLHFLKKLHIVFYSGCTSLPSHQQWMRVPFSPRPHQCLFVDLLIIAILTGVK